MKLKALFELAIKKGIDADLRGADHVKKVLQQARETYDDLKEAEKAEFDTEKFWNPYDDSRILNGDLDTEVQSILVGIDMEASEILLADRLREKGERVDAVLAHHPEGIALASLYGVMHIQEDILHSLGVPINVAEGIMSDRIEEVQRALMPVNHNKAVDAARILGFPFLCTHTPADNCVTSFLQNMFDQAAPEKVKDVMQLLKGIPEYASAVKYNAGPKIVAGNLGRRAGKVFVDMTGGTSGSEDAYEQLANAGVGTIVGMHLKDKHRELAKKYHVNVVIAGHMSSDSIGMNIILDEFEASGIRVIPCSGLIRVNRLK